MESRKPTIEEPVINTEEPDKKDSMEKVDHSIRTSILIGSIMLAGAWIYVSLSDTRPKTGVQETLAGEQRSRSILREAVFPSSGIILPVKWGDLGMQMTKAGVIDVSKLKSIYEKRGSFAKEYENLLLSTNNGNIKITRENSGYILNLLWAFGLGNKNEILEKGEMTDAKYGGAGVFASTGGWTLAKGNAMEHYNKHAFVVLTKEEQALVDKVSRGIYRPCCGNSAHFPDCNHGMAMLGLLELMASQNISEENMWKTALVVNSYWFPDNYLALAEYEKEKGVEWKDSDPQEMLGFDYSSAVGNANIASRVILPERQRTGGSCS